jgi:hypothetical protein
MEEDFAQNKTGRWSFSVWSKLFSVVSSQPSLLFQGTDRFFTPEEVAADSTE